MSGADVDLGQRRRGSRSGVGWRAGRGELGQRGTGVRAELGCGRWAEGESGLGCSRAGPGREGKSGLRGVELGLLLGLGFVGFSSLLLLLFLFLFKLTQPNLFEFKIEF